MDAERAAEAIWRSWQAGEVIDHLPEGARPGSRAEGYRAQAALEALSGAPREGWKIAATSAAGQAHINVDGPLAGRLLAGTLHAPGSRVPIGANRMRVAEPEFAFRLARDVTARRAWTRDEAMDVVGALHLTIELPDSRFADFTSAGGPALIADNACGRDLVVGPAVQADWRAIDLARHPIHARVGARYTRDGIGSNVLGDPRDALAWCLGELGGLAIDLAEGELITTGTSVPPLEIEPGDRVVADFGALGTIEMEVAS